MKLNLTIEDIAKNIYSMYDRFCNWSSRRETQLKREYYSEMLVSKYRQTGSVAPLYILIFVNHQDFCLHFYRINLLSKFHWFEFLFLFASNILFALLNIKFECILKHDQNGRFKSIRCWCDSQWIGRFWKISNN